MKKFYQLASALLISIGLTACGSNSMFEAEMTSAVSEDGAQTKIASKDAAIPEGCVSWFDGCNTCTVKDGVIGGCTKMACKSQSGEAACRTFAPGFGASANGAADIPLQNSIHQFISELKLAGLETAPDLLPYSSQERRQLLLTGCAGLVTQNAQKMKAFQNIIGLKNPDTLELACQLFGDVDILGAVGNVEELM